MDLGERSSARHQGVVVRLVTRTIAAAAAIAVLAPFGLGACSSSDAAPTTGAAEAGSGERSVVIEDFAFSPDPLRIEAGTTVTFSNRDDFDHTATAEDGSFDSRTLAKDAAFEHTFDAPGTYPYLCSIHNSMTGSVVVS
jgi:plastocyanin